MEKSIGIGSPIAQIAGIYFPHTIDNYCKTVKGLKYYDVYMDDRIIIHHDKQFLKDLLEEIKVFTDKLGIHINTKKTQIMRLSRPFTFLKTRYILTDTGGIIKKMPRDVIKRQKRKMKSLIHLVEKGIITKEDYEMQYFSWRGDKEKYNAYYILKDFDKLYKELTLCK